MTQVQMNVRLDDQLKARGDAILARRGISTTEAVRGLWQYVAEHEDVPKEVGDIIHPDREAERQRRIKAARESAGLLARLCEERGWTHHYDGPVDYKKLRDEMYDEKYEEYLAMRGEQ